MLFKNLKNNLRLLFKPKMQNGPIIEQPPNADAIYVADAIRSQLERDIGSLKQYNLEKFSYQNVTGMNYKLKIKTDDGTYVHVKVFRPEPETGFPPEIKEIKPHRTYEDRL